MSAAVGAATRALYDSGVATGWSQTTTEAEEMWARKVLAAALPHLTEGLAEVVYDALPNLRLGSGHYLLAEDLATAITEELKRRIEA